MDLTATFQLTDREYRGLMRHSPLTRLFTAVSLFPVLTGTLPLLFGDSNAWWLAVFGLGMLIYVETLAVHISARKVTAQLPGPWTLHLTEETYTLRTASSGGVVAWSACHSVRERGGFWFLGTSRLTAEVIPKRAFDEHQQADLAAFLARRLPPAREPWCRMFA
ncbi:YcxB family protein [Streptomyces sp. NPDC058964]|uniref:YcxB family protein n=1 Tax=Streptomyces sp. NPDC058964 TaxID=3346681 RepID=UPI0036B05E49